jgi:hypothetical protein
MRLRFIALFLCLASAVFAAAPAEVVDALKRFQPEPPAGWSFTQTTEGQGESLVERCEAKKPAFDRWTLIAKNGHPPTEAELREYAEIRSRRSRAGTAPKVTDQIDVTSIELVQRDAERVTYRARLVPGESRDTTAEYLRVTFVFHEPTATIESLELSNTEPFSPTLGVRIVEMKTGLLAPHRERPRPAPARHHARPRPRLLVQVARRRHDHRLLRLRQVAPAPPLRPRVL